MKSKGKKKEELDQLKKDLAEAKNLIVAQFQGITVEQDTDLRTKVRATNSKYRVVKNTLAKVAPVFVFKTGMVEGRVVNLNDLNAIASLPSKEELIAKLLFLLNAPAQRIAVATNGVARNLAIVVGQAVEQKKFQE